MRFARLRFGQQDSLVTAEGVLAGKFEDKILVRFNTATLGIIQLGLPYRDQYSKNVCPPQPIYLEYSKKPFSDRENQVYEEYKRRKRSVTGNKTYHRKKAKRVGEYKNLQSQNPYSNNMQVVFEDFKGNDVTKKYTQKEFDEYIKNSFLGSSNRLMKLYQVGYRVVDDIYNLEVVYKVIA